MAAYAGFDVEVAGYRFELCDAAGCGVFFLVGELWVGVEVFVQVLVFTEVWTMLGGDVGDVRHCGGGNWEYVCVMGSLVESRFMVYIVAVIFFSYGKER